MLYESFLRGNPIKFSYSNSLRCLHIFLVCSLYFKPWFNIPNIENIAIWTCCGVDNPAVWFNATCLLSATILSINESFSTSLVNEAYLILILSFSWEEWFAIRLLYTLSLAKAITPSLHPVAPKYLEYEYTPNVLYGIVTIKDLNLSQKVP